MTLVTERNAASVLEFLDKHPRLVTDTETNGLYTWHGSRLIGVSVAPPGAPRKHCYYLPFRHKPGGNLSQQRLRQLMKLLSRKKKTYWNAKFDTHMLTQEGMRDDGDSEDVMLLFHLMDENQWKTGGSYELKASAEKYIDGNARKAELRLTELLMERGLGKGDMQELTPAEVDEYASDDVYYTERWRELLMPAAAEWDLAEMWSEISRYSLITRLFEQRGMLLDVPLIEQYAEECEQVTAKLLRRIRRMAGHEINLRSNPQLRAWLNLPSTAQDYIDQVEWTLTGEQGKAIKTLQEYRKWDRALTTYYRPFLASMDGDEVFHPNLQLHGTVSGRPSAKGTPNILAMPRYTGIYKVKDVIKARRGYSLLSADYSQAELRLGAHYSHDEFNIKCFNEGKSPHKLLMADLTSAGVDIDYDNTKRVSFAVMYGTGAPTLAKELKKDEHFARQVLKAAHALHPNYRPMLKQAEETARKHGYIRLWTGRVRHFNTLNDPQPWYHKACSNLIQGGVAEIIRHAILRLAERLPEYDAHMQLQVYDQILLEAPTKQMKVVAKIVEEEMTRDFPFSVPMAVEIKTGQRWGQLKEIHP